MSEKVRLLALAGSLRKGSYNKNILKIAVRGAREAGAEVALLDLLDYPMPLYNQDDQDAEGLPENAEKLKEMMKSSDGFIIASPEYNSSVSGVLKNTIDWTSRQTEGESVLECYRDKNAVIMSASPSYRGGLRGLFALRFILQNIGVMVIPEMEGISRAHEAFNEDGSLKDARLEARIEGLGRKLVEVTRKLKS
jgi:chromate reductase